MLCGAWIAVRTVASYVLSAYRSDAELRHEYHEEVRKISGNAAYESRNQTVIEMREKSSIYGLLMATCWKREPPTLPDLHKKY